LLTDEDLNRLEQYVVDKNRLHNRYLHGWGVACGLEVTCDLCDPGHVVVRTGYALSPCGDDVIVCNDQSVDVCSLINSCEPREPFCESPFDRPPRDCTGGARKWVLAICYDEKPVRGITAQLGAGDSTASARCKCGGSGGCGCNGSCGTGGACGCQASEKSQAQECSCGPTKPLPGKHRAYKPQCEPTQICEGYRFMVYPAPKDVLVDPKIIRSDNKDLMLAWLYANRARFGPLIERLLCCLLRAMELRQGIREGRPLDQNFAMSAYRDYAAALAEFAEDFAIHRCTFVSRTRDLLNEAEAFDWNSPAFRTNAARTNALDRNVSQLDLTWSEIVSECLCSAFLPSCPPPANTNCVPLATITISTGECRIVEICNWSDRKLLISWPTLSYWFSWLPWHKLREWITAICCGPDRGRAAMQVMELMIGTIFANLKTASGTGTPQPPPPAPAPENMTGAARARVATTPVKGTLKEAFDADNLLSHFLGNFDTLRTEGAAATGAPGWAELIARFADVSPGAAELVPNPRMTALTERLDAAEARLKQQSKDINKLKRGR
jgi:hypothetical protein